MHRDDSNFSQNWRKVLTSFDEFTYNFYFQSTIHAFEYLLSVLSPDVHSDIKILIC